MKYASLKMLAGAAMVLMLASTPALASDNSSNGQSSAPLYPNSTRTAPKNDLSDAKVQKNLQDGLTAFNTGDYDKASQLLQPIADANKSKYAQAKALEGLGLVAAKKSDIKGASDMFQRAVTLDVLPNDEQFQLMLQLANYYLVNQQFQQSIDMLEKWRSGGRSDSAESHGWEGEAYLELKQYPQAITQLKQAQSMTDKPDPNWNQALLQAYNDSGQKDQAAQIAQKQLAANANDPVALENSVNLLIETKKYSDAQKMLENARANGGLKNEQEYVMLAKLYMMAGAQADDPSADSAKATAVLQEGMSKGVVTSNAANEELLGDAALNGGDYASAEAAYKKAMPGAKNGDVFVKAGIAMLQQNSFSEAKTTIQQGIDKGVTHKGRAYIDIANANIGLKNKLGAVDAMMDAQKDPETAEQAKKWLQKSGVGN